MSKNIKVVLIFLTVTVFLFGKLFFLLGITLGGDWGLPSTLNQMDVAFEEGISAWTNIGNPFGIRQLALTSIPLLFLIKSASWLGISGDVFSKLLLLFLFFFAAYSMYSLLKFFKIKHWLAILGGIIYITTPIFFNYTIMGWVFILFMAAIIPITIKYFIKANKENKNKYTLVAGIFYAIAAMQPQAIIFLMLIFLILALYLIQDKKSLLIYGKNLLITSILLFVLNAFWLWGFLLVPDKSISGSDIVNSGVSLGILGHFQPINVIRLFGSLFNFQYETIMENSGLDFLSFILPILALGALFVKKNRKIIIAFWIIGLVSIAMYILNFNRDILLYIPFSNVFRDFARFTILSTFAYVILALFFLNYLFINNNKRFKKLGIALVLIWIFSIFPWWTGGLTDWEYGIGSDMRLRTKVFPTEYIELENNLAKKNLDQKAFYLPIGGTVDFEDDKKFHGMFKETQDIFAGYSPVPGVLGISDRSYGHIDKYIKTITESTDKNLIDILQPTNINYIILRKNMKMENKKDIDDMLKRGIEDGKINKYFEEEKIGAYKINDFLPHFYISSGKFRPTLEFKKINPAKYRVRVHGAEGKFPLVFSESFHEGWKAYATKSQISKLKSQNEEIDRYKILDGNEEDQASREEVAEFVEKGWVTDVGDGEEKEIKHTKWDAEKQKEVPDYTEKYAVDFISKNFHGTIQNDNLPRGKFYETWFQDPVVSEEEHLMANGYANSWVVDTDAICGGENTSGDGETLCIKNPDGTYDMELVIEFWPQRLFYLGLGISGATLAGCLGYLSWAGIMKIRSKKWVGLKD